MKKNWIHKKTDPAKIKEIAEMLKISPVAAGLLLNRGIDNPVDAEKFLNPTLDSMHNPFYLPDMEKAVVRLRAAVDHKEKILIYGDSDVDGVTSIAILVRALKNLGAQVEWVIPGAEGYGLHASILEKFKAQGYRLIVTVDTGTSAVEEIRYANTIGLEVIITDHHSQPEILPPAFAIVNPNLKSSVYPYKSLAGCVTAFKLAQGIMFSFNRTFNKDYCVLDIETTGLSPTNGTIIEIAAVHIRNFVPIAKFHTLINPERPIPPEITKINGITDKMVENSPLLETVMPKFMSFLGDKTIVAHNASFDVGFLKAFAKIILEEDIKNPVIDTLQLARAQYTFNSHSLTNLVKELKIERETAHRAMDDTMATVKLFEKIEYARDPRLQYFLEDQMDLVCLGTIADVVPLLGENRVIVKEGIPRLLKTRKIGLKRLLEACDIPVGDVPPEKFPSAKDLSWTVTPHLNAAGRFDKADLTARLLLTESDDEAKDLVHEIAKLNVNRRNLQKINLEKFMALAKEQCDLEKDKVLFVVAENLGGGVTGIVASNLVREFSRPAILIIKDETGEATGSSRSLAAISILDILTGCEDLLVKFGGHPQAAGLTVKNENIEKLRKKVLSLAQEKISERDFEPVVEIEHPLTVEEVTKELVYEISRLEPYGQGNPVPVFSLQSACLKGMTQVGAQKNHIKLVIGDAVKSVNAVGWSMSNRLGELSLGKNHDFAFRLEMDRWNGRELPQMVLVDLSPASNASVGKAQSVQLDLVME